MSKPAILEVAESMYQAARGATAAKMPESLDELGTAPQRRYLMLAQAAIAITGPPTAATSPPPSDLTREALDVLADELAWKLNHPMGGFSERVRTAFALYEQVVGAENVNDEVRKAMEL